MAIGNTDVNTVQPYDFAKLNPFYAKEWVAKVNLLMKKAKEQKISPKQLTTCWPTASSCRTQLFFTLIDMKYAKTKKEDREEIADFFWGMAKSLYKKDVCGLEASILRNEDGITKLLGKISLAKANPSVAKLLGRLYNAIHSYGCGLNTDLYVDYTLETEGPYDLSPIYGPNTILVVKKAVNLRPVELWPETKRLSADNVTIYCVYRNVGLKMHAYSLHTLYKGDVINNLAYFAVEVDGNQVTSVEQLSKLKEELEKACKEQWLRLKSRDFENMKALGPAIRNYGMKRVFEAVGMDWHPSRSMIDAVKTNDFVSFDYLAVPENEKEKSVEYWSKLLDPRVDFYPGNAGKVT